MDLSRDEWFAEYDRLNAALAPYRNRVSLKIYGPDAPQELTEPERVFSDLLYYWAAGLVNNDDVFGYMPFIIEHRADFVTVGAEGTLKALDKLIPFFRQQQELKDDAEKREYWGRTKDERASAEALAEGVLEFARLLLAYAQTHLPAPGEP